MKKKKGIQIFILILSCLLIVNVALLSKMGVYSLLDDRRSETVIIDQNIITPDTETSGEVRESATEETSADTAEQGEQQSGQYTEILSLHRGKTEDITPFKVENMFPGDSVEKTYAVDVKYQDTVTVHFSVDVGDAYKVLAKGLKCRVRLENSGKVMYDGLMADMAEPLACTLKSDTVVTDQLRYVITVYLDTSAGNEYQNQKLMADFKWWVDEEGKENLKPVPTGDRMIIYGWLIVSLTSVCIVVFLLLKKLREGERQHGE